MGDQELLRRVAEIEGYVNGAEVAWDWNPLADTERGRSQAFELLEKYGLEVQCSFNGGDPDKGIYGWAVRRGFGDDWMYSRTSLPRAICLAVIASKGGGRE